MNKSAIHVNTKPLSRVQIRRALKRLKCSIRRAALDIGKSPAMVCEALSGQKKAGPTLDALRALIAKSAAAEVNVHVNTETMPRRGSQGQSLPRRTRAHPVGTSAASREGNGGRM